MKNFKCVLLVFAASLITVMASAQMRDSLPAKKTLFSKFNFSNIHIPKVQFPQWKLFKKDSTQKKDSLEKKVSSVKPFSSEIKVKEKKQKDTTHVKSLFSKIQASFHNVFKKDTLYQLTYPQDKKITDSTLLGKRILSKNQDANTNENLVNVKVPEVYRVPEQFVNNNTEKLLAKTTDTSILQTALVKDTAKKNSWLSRLNFAKKPIVKKDSTIITNSTIKDTTKKTSWFTKLNLAKKPVVKKDSTIITNSTIKDTTKKTSWFTKLNLAKKPVVKKDSVLATSAAVKDSVTEIKNQVVAKVKDTLPSQIKDTAKKTSWLSRLNFAKKPIIKKDSVLAKSAAVKDTLSKTNTKVAIVKDSVTEIKSQFAAKIKDTLPAQIKDTAKKASWLSRLNFAKKTVVKKDSAILVIAPEKKSPKKKEIIVKLKDTTANKIKDTSSIYKNIEKRILNYTATTTISILGGANFTKQIIDAGSFNSNFNYVLNDINDDVYKTGYFGGIRLDGLILKKHAYSLSLDVSNLSSGAKYTNPKRLSPVVGNFSPFKAEDHFFALNLAAHYKKLIPLTKSPNYTFYLVGGPSIFTRLTNTSIDNQVTNAYKQFLIKGDLGLEFNNRSLYTLFFHYQHNLSSFTKSPIQTNINSFQIGVVVKATDLL